jgi:hypothetical protein
VYEHLPRLSLELNPIGFQGRGEGPQRNISHQDTQQLGQFAQTLFSLKSDSMGVKNESASANK